MLAECLSDETSFSNFIINRYKLCIIPVEAEKSHCVCPQYSLSVYKFRDANVMVMTDDLSTNLPILFDENVRMQLILRRKVLSFHISG